MLVGSPHGHEQEARRWLCRRAREVHEQPLVIASRKLVGRLGGRMGGSPRPLAGEGGGPEGPPVVERGRWQRSVIERGRCVGSP